jgi:hypothetical protein
MLYRRRVKDRAPAAATGARLGAAGGGFGCFFFAIVTLAMLVYHPEALREFMSTSISQMSKYGYSAETIRQMLESIKSPEGLAFTVGVWFFMTCLILLVGSSLGGAWYYAWVRRRAQS